VTDLPEKTLPPRGQPDPAPHGQLVTFILTDRKPMYHRTTQGAQREREYLRAKTGKDFKLLKVLMISSEVLETHDVVLVPKEAPHAPA
jgi:hypothetical protein